MPLILESFSYRTQILETCQLKDEVAILNTSEQIVSEYRNKMFIKIYPKHTIL